MLDRLVLADRPVEHARAPWHSRRRAPARRCPSPTASAAIRMRSGFMPCRMYSKPRPSSPMRSSTGISKSVDEQLVGVDRLAAHLLDLAHLDRAAVEVGVEQAQAVGRLLHLLQRRGAGQQQDLVGDLRGRDPDLLAVDDVAVAVAHGAGLELRGVEAGVGLGDGEAGLAPRRRRCGGSMRALAARACRTRRPD